MAETRKHAVKTIPDLDKLPGGAMVTTREVALAFGFAEITVRTWRRQGKGPRFVMLEDRPRYFVRDLLAWRDAGAAT